MARNPVNPQALKVPFGESTYPQFRDNSATFKSEILYGSLVTIDEIAPINIDIPHGLGRVPVGWVVSRDRGAINGAPIERKAPDGRFVYVQCAGTGAVKFDIWVF
jgi:hypothetical protein